jgi:hypothetical protein
MECPNCHEKLPGRDCPHCETLIPLESIYCLNCGAHLVESESEDSIGQDDEFDFENRVLCPDGTCTGIILNGKCTECGKKENELKQG